MITLSTADKALKDVYLGVVADQLNTNVNPLLAKIKQSTSDVWGKEIVKMAPYGLNGGIGAGTETGSLPVASGNNYAQFRSTLKNLYGKIEISDKAVRASENSAGAFVNLLNSEMEGLIKASKFNFGRMLYGDGTGFIAGIVNNTTTSSGNTTFTVDSVKNLAEGMLVDIVSSAGVKYTGITAPLVISSIDRTNKTVTIPVTGFTADDTKNGGYSFCIQGSYGNELTGLGAIFGNSATLYGLTRANYGWLSPKTISAGSGGSNGHINDIIMQAAIDKLEEEMGSKVDFIVCSAGVKRDYQYYLASYRSNVDVMELAGGYKAISYNGIPVVSDRFAPDNTMYLLDTSKFTLHELCDWKWLEGEGGRVLHQIAGTPTYSATLVKYADLICDQPGGQAKITDIVELSTIPSV